MDLWFRWRSRNRTKSNTPLLLLPPTFYARCVSIYDGDTYQIVCLFRGKWTRFNCRAYGWDAPEMKPIHAGRTTESLEQEKKAALAAKDWLESWWNRHQNIALIHFYGFDKYGRVLAEIPGLFDEFMKTGYIKPYFGKTKLPIV